MINRTDWRLVHDTTGHGYEDAPCLCPLCDAVAALVRGNRLREADFRARLRALRRGAYLMGPIEVRYIADLRVKNWRPQ